MAQKEDILEQIVEEYLTHEGYFVQHNIKFKPITSEPEYDANKDRVPSDIDVLAFHPCCSDHQKVIAVNVKSWQTGFNIDQVLKDIENNRMVSGRPTHLRYRELIIPKWSNAYIRAIKDRTGCDRFTYLLAATWVRGEKVRWEDNARFIKALKGNPIKVITLREMVEKIEQRLTQTPAATDIGRTLQLFLAAGLRTRTAPPKGNPDTIEDEEQH